MRGYIPPADDDERLFVRRLGDLVQVVRQRGTSRSTPFLSDRQQELARAALAGLGFEGYAFDGGYPDAERRILRLFGEYGAQEPLPAVCLFAQTLRADRALTHRDYLGALMSLGIRRECIGDILLSEDGAYLFVLDTVAPLVCDELSSVGRCSVCVRAGRAEELPGREERPAQTATVASLRLDAVLAAMLHISRGDAVQLVKSGMVEVNHVSTVSAHYEVFENDVFSIRGRGKYKLCGVGAKSRKGRTMESAGRHLDSMTLSAPAILYGGGVIYDFEHDIRIRNTLLSKPSARRAVCDVLARFPGVGVEIMTEDGGICVVRANEYTYRHTVHEGLTYRMAPLEELDGGWNKVLFACSHEMLMQIQDFLDARKYPGVYFIATNRNYFEIMPEGAAKGAALGELCTYMGIPIENTVAIGDYFNDIELMRAAGHSVAMGNAPKEVQLAADTVTGRCLDGGVAEVLYGLIRKYG